MSVCFILNIIHSVDSALFRKLIPYGVIRICTARKYQKHQQTIDKPSVVIPKDIYESQIHSKNQQKSCRF